jgi:hypothetical protein
VRTSWVEATARDEAAFENTKLSTNAALDPSDRVLDAERAISNYLAPYRGTVRKQRRKLEKPDNEIVSLTGDFWSDVRMFIALRLKQLDRERELLLRSLLKLKKKGIPR